VEPNHFGQPKLFKDEGIPFNDSVSRFNAVDYMQDNNAAIYPIVLADPAFKDPDQMDGIIEPLAIRTIGTQFRSAEQPFTANTFRGHVIDGNIDPVKGTDFILQFVDRKIPLECDHFQDAQNTFTDGVRISSDPVDALLAVNKGKGLFLSGTAIYNVTTGLGRTGSFVGLAQPGITSYPTRKHNPFNDTTPSPQFNTLMKMSGALEGSTWYDYAQFGSSDTGMTNFLKKSTTAGFHYANNTYDGTDSIAFGGLLRLEHEGKN